MRVLGLMKADEHSESEFPPKPEDMERMGKFMETIVKAGVLIASDGLMPSSHGKRVKFDENTATVIDGPFTESKELVASYALLEVKDMAEAVEWTTRFLKVLGKGECELRPLFDPSGYRPGATEKGCADRLRRSFDASSARLAPVLNLRFAESLIAYVPDSPTHHAIDAVWRIESARLIAGLTRLVHDISLAEDLAQEASDRGAGAVAGAGVPDNPGAWLMTAAKRRAIDHLRRDKMLARRHDALARELERQTEGAEVDLDDYMGDDLLRLVFMTCHPALSKDARVALTLRLLGGLTTEEVARAFLVAEPTIAQRIVRAKRTLIEKQAAFELPPPPSSPSVWLRSSR